MASFGRGARYLIVFLATFYFLSPARGAQVRLRWDPSPGPDVIGYKLYRGTAPNTFTSSIRFSATTTNTLVTNLVEGAFYYFAVTAVDNYELESDYSNQVIYLAPLTTPSA